eukprot:CAMPEP_0202977614 /NCGR_PEP_ID=MMETSP1396-20130829/84351_1 /ASSEMBLY_ACC=CAM_ASM_000872 /TAXON_ID= /ORGANISM="Pseudokeronopsis sp., Strain Brazil" /LENGTH=108 /DNA_ID=CAMNT_0049716391 /DNA_START=350 /DNA_END=679 /DNA_ORIENTATION=-
MAAQELHEQQRSSYNKLQLPGDAVMPSIFDRLFRRKGVNNDGTQDLKNPEGWSDLEEQDKGFDEWRGVSREGKQFSSDEEAEEEEGKDEDDNDDGPDGGEMMPIPDVL